MTDTGGLYKAIVDNLCEGVFVIDRESQLLFWSRGAERITGCTLTDVKEQLQSPLPMTHQDEHGTPIAKERCPLLQTISDGISREAKVYLNHKLGHRVPVRIHTVALRDEQGHIWGALESFVEAFTTS